ncbi:MAG TPA: hypothetical protein VNA30_04170, partial [Mycobacteriales bacterium]|nr:hypothetical protein [Mycobacteriales bacterium]
MRRRARRAWGSALAALLGVALAVPVAAVAPSLAEAASTDNAIAWGYNGNGQLGDGSTTDRLTPVAVALPAGTTVTAVAAGALHSLALTSTGAVLAWGYNNYRQLGDGSTTDRLTPVAVALPAGTTVTAVAAGGLHSLALTSTGAV